jgi:hypothetical protein
MPWSMNNQRTDIIDTENACILSSTNPYEHELFDSNFCHRSCEYDGSSQSIADLIRRLIDYLHELLPFLSSILQCQRSDCSNQSNNLIDVIERIYRLRSMLLVDIHQRHLNSVTFDAFTIDNIVYQLHCLLRYLEQNEQLHTESGTSFNLMTSLPYLFERLLVLIEYSRYLVTFHDNRQVG